MGHRKDSIWGMLASLGLVNTTSFVFLGTKIVLDLEAYCSLRTASDLRDSRSLAKMEEFYT